jgi:hypothetical protein
VRTNPASDPASDPATTTTADPADGAILTEPPQRSLFDRADSAHHGLVHRHPGPDDRRHLAARLSGTARTTAALTSAFHTVFLWTVPFMGFALFLAVAMKEKPLSDEMREVAAGRVEVAQY